MRLDAEQGNLVQGLSLSVGSLLIANCVYQLRKTDLIEGGPLLLEDVEADIAVGVNVRMEARRDELDDGRLVGVA